MFIQPIHLLLDVFPHGVVFAASKFKFHGDIEHGSEEGRLLVAVAIGDLLGGEIVDCDGDGALQHGVPALLGRKGGCYCACLIAGEENLLALPQLVDVHQLESEILGEGGGRN